MDVEEKKLLEREILELTDKLIEKTIKLENANSVEKQQEFDKCLEVVNLLIEKLSNYLSGKDEHLEELLRQLTRQKLPDQRVLTSFNNFSSNLNELIRQGLELYNESKPPHSLEIQGVTAVNSEADYQTDQAEEKQTYIIQKSCCDIKSENRPEESACKETLQEITPGNTCISTSSENSNEGDSLEKILRQIFSDKVIIKNYKFHGFELDYYFPELNLAIEKGYRQAAGNSIWKDYHCSKAGITLVRVTDEELGYYRRVSRHLKRYLSSSVNNIDYEKKLSY